MKKTNKTFKIKRTVRSKSKIKKNKPRKTKTTKKSKRKGIYLSELLKTNHSYIISETTMTIKHYARIYPRINNENILDFQIPGSRYQVQLNEVQLHFKIQIPAKPGGKTWEIIPQNWFGPKQFSSMEVKINDEIVANRSMANEYFLASYFNTIVSYQKGAVASGCNTMGIFDYDNMNQVYLSQLAHFDTWVTKRKLMSTTGYDFEIVMPLQNTIFFSENVLPSNLKWSVCFERAKSVLSCLSTKQSPDMANDYLKTVFELEDVFLSIPYLEHKKTQEREANWSVKPLTIHYDNYDVNRFVIPSGSTNCRLTNLLNGNLPKAIIFGIIKEDAYLGDYTLNSTLFSNKGVRKMDIKVDGRSVAGCPYENSEVYCSIPYVRLMELIGQYGNPDVGSVMNMREFKSGHYLHCAYLDNQIGSLSVEMEFNANVPDGYILIICGIRETDMKIDKFGNFEIK